MAKAAYNLCVLLSKDRIDEALIFGNKAVALHPDEPRYARTLAFCKQKKGDLPGAARVLDSLVTKYPAYADAYLPLGVIYEKLGKKTEAAKVYQEGLAAEGIPPQYKIHMKARLDALKSADPDAPQK